MGEAPIGQTETKGQQTGEIADEGFPKRELARKQIKSPEVMLI